MVIEDVLRAGAERDQLVHMELLPARTARIGHLGQPLDPDVARLVPPGGLWSHQASAIEHARAGRSVAIATGTASGKSLCYQLPIAEAVLAEEPGTALLLFPTKALAQDQLRSLGDAGVNGLVAVAYDGDTPSDQRAWARRHANVVLTNPDMLHVGILPNHGRWATFLMRLRYVVLDELHTLRGIFGTHVAHLVRRLRRLCEHYDSSPTFIFSSATIGAPGALAGAICGLPVAEVTQDGSPSGERVFALWNPPLLDEHSGTRGSSNVEAANLLAGFVGAGYRGIAFTRSRKGSELVAAHTKRQLPGELADAVRPYRGGYLASERREIERQLFGGELRGVAATNALELGVDIGGLDACILNGFPGTIASMWQQAGRAGRARQRAAAVLVAGEDQLDQWLMAHPREVFVRPPEPAIVNPSNPFVLLPHLACAAYELPLTDADSEYWADDLDGGVRQLVLDGTLRLRDRRAFYAGGRSPAAGVSLRSGSSEEYQIVDMDNRLIGTIDGSRAFSGVHPGAVYLHQGQHYTVQRLDIADHVAVVEPAAGDEMTQARSLTDIRFLGEDEHTTVGRARLSLGPVEVREQVVGYQRKSVYTGEVLGVEDLDLPPTRLVTRAFWYTIGDDVLTDARLAPAQILGTMHAIEHAGIGILPLFTICDRWDVGGVSMAAHPDTGAATIVIYDGYPGGAGIAELGFAAGRRHVDATLEVITACGCDGGCPSCVQSPKCGNWNEPLDKEGAIAVLRAVLAERRARRGRRAG